MYALELGTGVNHPLLVLGWHIIYYMHMQAPVCSDLDDYVLDIGGVIEDQLVMVGFSRPVARSIVFKLAPQFRELMRERMV